MDDETRGLLVDVLKQLRAHHVALDSLATSADATGDAFASVPDPKIRQAYTLALGKARMSKKRLASAESLKSIDGLIAKLGTRN